MGQERPGTRPQVPGRAARLQGRPAEQQHPPVHRLPAAGGGQAGRRAALPRAGRAGGRQKRVIPFSDCLFLTTNEGMLKWMHIPANVTVINRCRGRHHRDGGALGKEQTVKWTRWKDAEMMSKQTNSEPNLRCRGTTKGTTREYKVGNTGLNRQRPPEFNTTYLTRIGTS